MDWLIWNRALCPGLGLTERQKSVETIPYEGIAMTRECLRDVHCPAPGIASSVASPCEKRGPLARLAFQGGMTKLLDLPPPFSVHRRSHQSPPPASRSCGSADPAFGSAARDVCTRASPVRSEFWPRPLFPPGRSPGGSAVSALPGRFQSIRRHLTRSNPQLSRPALMACQ